MVKQPNLKSPSNSSVYLRIISLVFWVLIGLLALGNFQRMQLSSTVAIYGHDLVLPLLIGLIWLKEPQMVSKWKIIFNNSALRALVVWIGILFVYQLSQQNWIYLAYCLRIALYIAFGMTVWSTNLISARHKWLGLGLYGLVLVGWGWWQYIFLPDTRFLAVLGWDDHYYRLIGTSFDPNFTGAIIGLLILIWLYLTQTLKFKPYVINPLVTFSLIITLILTYSRASYLSLATGYLVFNWANSKTKLITRLTKLAVHKQFPVGLLFVALASLAVTVMSQNHSGEGVNLLRTASIQARITNERQIIHNWSLSNWLVGTGFKSNIKQQVGNQVLTPPNLARLPNNLLIGLISGWGMVGVFLMLRALWLMKPWTKLNSGQLGLWVLVLTHSQFNNTLLHPLVLPVLLLGLSALQTSGEKLKLEFNS